MENQKVIEKLKSEHQEILDIFTMAKKGYGFSDHTWKDTLIRAKQLFEHHLDYEDETIYNDKLFKKTDFGHYPETARLFQEEMKDITVEVEKFFKKYEVTTDWPDFSRDYANLVNLLEKRIKAEESVLFEKFEKMDADSTIEQIFKLSASNEKTIEKVIFDENLHYIHLLFPQGEGLPEHRSNSNVYMTVLKGVLSIGLNDQTIHEYSAPTLVTIPFDTKMNVTNQHQEMLELIIVKAPAPGK